MNGETNTLTERQTETLIAIVRSRIGGRVTVRPLLLLAYRQHQRRFTRYTGIREEGKF